MYDRVGDFFIDLCAPSVEGRTSALKERSQNPLFNTLQGELKATLFSKAEHLLRRKKKHHPYAIPKLVVPKTSAAGL